MPQFLKLTGIITVIVGVILTILQRVILIQAGDGLAFGEIGILLGSIFITYVISGVVCFGMAKIIELLEDRKSSKSDDKRKLS